MDFFGKNRVEAGNVVAYVQHKRHSSELRLGTVEKVYYRARDMELYCDIVSHETGRTVTRLAEEVIVNAQG